MFLPRAQIISLLQIQNFKYTVTYIPGKDNSADPFYHLPLEGDNAKIGNKDWNVDTSYYWSLCSSCTLSCLNSGRNSQRLRDSNDHKPSK